MKYMETSCNRENMQKFIDALRSDRFIQGTGRLERINQYTRIITNCCLGVACRVAQENGVKLAIIKEIGYIVFDAESSYLPTQVSAWLGISTNNPLLTFTRTNDTDFTTSATIANDSGEY